jgi:ADP-heptose:LPS heptosyltransferase
MRSLLPRRETWKRPLLRVAFALARRMPRRSMMGIPIEDLRSIVVFQDGGVGDVLRAFPLLVALRTKFPEARLALLTTQKMDLASLLPDEASPCEHLLVDFSEGYAGKLRRAGELRREGFDLLIGPSRGDGVMECAAMAVLMGGKWRIGFDSAGSGVLYTHSEPFREAESILTQNCRLLRHVGIDCSAENVVLRITETDQQFAEKLLEPAQGQKIVAVHPWAVSHPEFRSWPLDRFALFLQHLATTWGCKLLLLGSKGDKPAAEAFARQIGTEHLMDLTGSTTLSQTSAVIRASDLFVGNDSSLLHFANAWMTPAIAFFGATSPEQVLPPKHRCTVITAGLPVPCRPCYRHQPLFAYRCDRSFECLRALSVEEAIRMATPAIERALCTSGSNTREGAIISGAQA